MIAWLSTKFAKILGSFAALAAILGGVYLKGRSDKSRQVEKKTMKKQIKIAKDVKDVEENIRKSDPESKRDRLLREYSRDPK